MPVELLEFHRSMVEDLMPSAVTPLKSSSALAATAPRGSEGKGDGLLIAAKGLGLRRILLTFLQVYSDPRNLVLLLNTPSREVDVLREDLMAAIAARTPLEGANKVHPNLFKVINNETPASDRSDLYRSGGVLSVTSRILVVDMLNKVLPFDLVLGIIVNHAHRVTETSTEAFILRLYRDENKIGFIKALSDEPEAFTHGFWKLERSMKLLFLRHVFLWPRFHMRVHETLEGLGKVHVIESQVPYTQSMRDIQAGLVDCIDQCLAELRRSNPTIDAEEFTVENAFFRSFDQLIRVQLDPIWHRVSQKTKQLVGDLKILRKLLSYLVSYDCVTFNSFLETIVAANASEPSAVFRSEASQSQWLFLDAAHTVLSAARQRVYRRVVGATGNLEAGIPPGVEPVLEEQPKWRALIDALRVIEADRSELLGRGEVPGPVLIMVEGDRACTQLREVLADCDLTVVKPEAEEKPLRETFTKQRKKGQIRSSQKRSRSEDAIDETLEQEGVLVEHTDAQIEKEGQRRGVSFSSTGSEQLLNRLIQKYFRWKGGMSAVTRNLFNKSRAGGGSKSGSTNVSANEASRGRGRGGRGAPPNKRRRVRGGSASATPETGRTPDIGESSIHTTFEQEAAQIAEFLSQADPVATVADDIQERPPEDEDVLEPEAYFGIVDPSSSIVIRPYASTSTSFAGGSAANGDDDARVLEDLRPSYIVIYDPDLGFIRRVEVFRALNPTHPLQVHFLVYSNSVEEQRFLSQIRREKTAFEKLIREKSIMAIPIDQDGRTPRDPEEEFWQKLDTRLAGGQRIPANEKNQVIVDVREFRSSLPSLLHARRMTLRACTLEVGDYVLSPQICVERKSISDLIQSLKSGRLYTQCEAMSLHYKIPVLLIEFDKDKAFSLHLDRDIRGEIDARDVGSRLALLCLHFPKLRIVWSSSAAATAEIVEDLKKNQEEPSMDDAMAVGVDNPETIDSAFNITPSDVLRSLPGITSKNYRYVMSKVQNLRELSEMPLERCQQLLGQEFGKMLYAFFRKNPKEEDM
ncbi:DNA repair protein (rad1) [Spizellomyces punctatus DAOM BR117]|uniref:DNA repair protein (Rad1) n=1 Tax=Spizellomyces punctatus (strain DAOM BR117) TaxID=645134 RepID=A0A0L0H8M0_SPIPD|nr:DNA repair protein (rad1) [Spizellomyces punctatus DAOM BR117]KNC97326.1 DNA repair protein (rad1) [Spizellomyces punctatus DAOM BR117]|eukprot:XP_016605366.1 DNA repair protein (rad1) [Spizellomyces punctatus DAOM BR117]